MNGTWFDTALADKVEAADESDRLMIAADAAAELANELIAAGTPGIHVYCLNRAATAIALVERLNAFR